MSELTAFDVEARANTQVQTVVSAMREVKEALEAIDRLLDDAEARGVKIDAEAVAGDLNRLYGEIGMIQSPVLRDAFLSLYAPVTARLGRLSGSPAS